MKPIVKLHKHSSPKKSLMKGGYCMGTNGICYTNKGIGLKNPKACDNPKAPQC
jgi:hypothetical protein